MITFRRMRPEDAAGVEKVELASFPVPWSRQSFWEAAANDKTHYILAVDGEEIIHPEDLQEMDTTGIVLPYGSDGATLPEQKTRDVLKSLLKTAADNNFKLRFTDFRECRPAHYVQLW